MTPEISRLGVLLGRGDERRVFRGVQGNAVRVHAQDAVTDGAQFLEERLVGRRQHREDLQGVHQAAGAQGAQEPDVGGTGDNGEDPVHVPFEVRHVGAEVHRVSRIVDPLDDFAAGVLEHLLEGAQGLLAEGVLPADDRYPPPLELFVGILSGRVARLGAAGIDPDLVRRRLALGRVVSGGGGDDQGDVCFLRQGGDGIGAARIEQPRQDIHLS